MTLASAQLRDAKDSRDQRLLKRGIERECRVNFILLKQMVAEREGRGGAGAAARVRAELNDVYNSFRSFEERLITACEDFEGRIMNNFSNLFVETWRPARPSEVEGDPSLREDICVRSAKLWVLGASRLFARLVQFIAKSFSFGNTPLPEGALSMGTGVLATWLICCFLQNTDELLIMTSDHPAYWLYSCFPAQWWGEARLKDTLSAEIARVEATRAAQLRELAQRNSVVASLTHKVSDLKKFVKKSSADIGAIGKKNSSLTRRDRKQEAPLLDAVADKRKAVVQAQRARDKLASSMAQFEVRTLAMLQGCG